MPTYRNTWLIVCDLMKKIAPHLKGFFPKDTEVTSREYDALRGFEGYVYFWIKDLERAMRMPKRLYVYFNKDALWSYDQSAKAEKNAIIEKIVAKIKEDYPPFANNTDKEEHGIYFKKADLFQ